MPNTVLVFPTSMARKDISVLGCARFAARRPPCRHRVGVWRHNDAALRDAQALAASGPRGRDTPWRRPKRLRTLNAANAHRLAARLTRRRAHLLHAQRRTGVQISHPALRRTWRAI